MRPRLLLVKGVSLVAPDCLVAEIIGEPDHGPLWIEEPSNVVIGIEGAPCLSVKAMRCVVQP
jgi:hypothetical protein